MSFTHAAGQADVWHHVRPLEELKLDGKQAAAKTVTRKRAVLHNALDYAVELKALGANNLPE